MRTSSALLSSFVLSAMLFAGNNVANAASYDHLKGRILLQVEENGEAWYVDPNTSTRFYLKSGDAGHAALRHFGLGITNAEIWKIPVGVHQETVGSGSYADLDGDGLSDKMEEALGLDPADKDYDDDGHSDVTELANNYNPYGAGAAPIDNTLVNRLKGRILLQVEGKGQAWYVNPNDGRRYYMADGAAAYDMMRSMSLGITDANLAQIPVYTQEVNCESSYDCVIGAVETGTPVKATLFSNITLFEEKFETWVTTKYTPPTSGGKFSWQSTITYQAINGVEEKDSVGDVESCSSSDTSKLVTFLKELKNGTASLETAEALNCEEL